MARTKSETRRPQAQRPDFGARRVPPGTEISYTAAGGVQRTLRAAEAGSITPENAVDAEVVDAFVQQLPATGEEG